MCYYNDQVLRAIETGCTPDAAMRTLNYIRDQNIKAESHTCQCDRTKQVVYVNQDWICSRCRKSAKPEWLTKKEQYHAQPTI